MIIKSMKTLFSRPMSRKRLSVLVASLIVLLVATSYFIYEGTKKTVTVTLDGEVKVIKTHADTVKDLLKDLNIKTRSEDYVVPALNKKIEKDMKVVWEPAKQVTITIDGKESKYWTTADTVGEFLKEQNIVVEEHDKLNVEQDSKIKNNLKITLEKAFSIKLVDGGKEKQVLTTSTTVADFLEQQGIKLNDLDRVEPKLTEKIQKDSVVNIIRVEKVTDVVEETIDFAVENRNDHTLAKGSQKVIQQGEKGLKKKEFEVILENGKEVSRKLIKEEVVKNSKTKIVAIGTKEILQTTSRGDQIVNEFYVEATAYTAYCNGCNGYTATGIDLRANPNIKVIAVDPSVIPLGTKVWVEGYGYAIAADTGKHIKGKRIDLFFPTKTDAYRWGRKTVKIRILK
jgi:uncharacterized protein YabE (DUF348 family)